MQWERRKATVIKMNFFWSSAINAYLHFHTKNIHFASTAHISCRSDNAEKPALLVRKLAGLRDVGRGSGNKNFNASWLTSVSWVSGSVSRIVINNWCTPVFWIHRPSASNGIYDIESVNISFHRLIHLTPIQLSVTFKNQMRTARCKKLSTLTWARSTTL